MEGSKKSLSGEYLGLWALMLCFGALGLMNLGGLRHDYDEGQYIALASAIASGEVPFKDFFYHQPAYYLYLLSFLPAPGPDTVWLYRLPAFVGTWLTGGVLYFLAKDGLKLRLSILAPALFYGSLLVEPGFLALPHGLMIFGTALGVYLIFLQGERRHVIAAGCVMACAVCLKALAISSIFAVALALVLLREHRSKLIPFSLSVAAVGLLGILGLHVLTDGGFVHALTLQFSRTSAQSGVQIMKSLPGLANDMEALGDVSSVAFNAAIHGLALTALPLKFSGNYLIANNTLHSLILGLVGLTGLFFRREKSQWFVILGLWWSMALGFILFAWSPAWKDYLIQYACPLALLGAFCLDGLWHRSHRYWAQRFLVLSIVGVAWLTMGASALDGMQAEADEMNGIQSSTNQSMAWLTFDPYLTFLTGSPEACGLRDPLTDFGLPTKLPGLEVFEGRRQTLARVMNCLQQAEMTGIWVDDESLMYIDQEFARYLLCQDRHLVVYEKRLHARKLRARVGLEIVDGTLCKDGW